MTEPTLLTVTPPPTVSGRAARSGARAATWALTGSSGSSPSASAPSSRTGSSGCSTA